MWPEDFDCTLYFIRHAESDANLHPEIVCGKSLEVPLTKKGWKQASLLGRRFWDEKTAFDHVYHSQAVRAECTAKQMLHVMHGFAEKVSPGETTACVELNELDQGNWQGEVRSEVYDQETLLRMNMLNNDFSPPLGESRRAKGIAMFQWVERTVLRNIAYLSAHAPVRIAIVSHGQAIRCLLHEILGFDASLTWRIRLDNASVTILRFTHEGWFLDCVNDTSHLRANW